MPLETRPFDPAVYLESEAAAAAYLTEALDFNDPHRFCQIVSGHG